MEIKSFPNNQDEYVGAEYAMRWFHGRTSGVFGAESNAAVTAAQGEMAVEVSDGVGWLSNDNADGIVWWTDAEKTGGAKLKLPLDLADGVLNRIDRVVVSWETTNYVARPQIEILKGKATAEPVPPELTSNNVKRQISLAKIEVKAGTAQITQSMITDERLDESVCGIVNETIKIDTSMVIGQFEQLRQDVVDIIADAQNKSDKLTADYTQYIQDLETTTKQIATEFQNRSEAEWKEWFDGVRKNFELEGGAAIALSNRLDVLEAAAPNATATRENGVVNIVTKPLTAKKIYFYAPYDFTETDTYTVNGSSVSIKDLNGENVFDAWKAGSPVSLILKGNTAFFKSGGGGMADTLPPMVTDLSAAAGNKKISVSYKNPVSDVLGGVMVTYNTERIPLRVSDGKRIDAGMSQKAELTGLANGFPVYIRVFPYNTKKQYQTVLAGATVSATPSEGPLQVTDVKLTGNNASPVLSWKNTPDPTYSVTVAVQKEGSAPTNPADGKEIYRGTGETVTVKGLKAGIQYYFGVFSLSAEGGYRPPVVTLPYSYALPQNVTDLTVEGTGSMPTIKWTAPAASPVYKETVVIQSQDAPVTDISEGTEIYRGQGISCKAVGLERLVKYFWTVFVVTTEGEYRKPVSTAEAYSYNIMPVFNDNSWEVLSSIAKEGNGALYFKVGDAKETPVNGTVGSYKFSGNQYPFILGFNHNEALEGRGIHMSFGKSALTGGKDVAYKGFYINPQGENKGGWESCYMRKNNCIQFYNIIPNDLKTVIVPCTKYTNNVGNSHSFGSITATQDYIFIQSEFEVMGEQINASRSEKDVQNQYKYYVDGNSKIRYNPEELSSPVLTWFRSPAANTTDSFCVLTGGGVDITANATAGYSFAPCFMLGSPVGA